MKKIILITSVLLGLASCTKHKAEPILPISEVDPNCPDTILFSTQIMNDIFILIIL